MERGFENNYCLHCNTYMNKRSESTEGRRCNCEDASKLMGYTEPNYNLFNAVLVIVLLLFIVYKLK